MWAVEISINVKAKVSLDTDLHAKREPRMGRSPLSFDVLLGRFQLLGEFLHLLVVGKTILVVLVQLQALTHLAVEKI